MKEPTWAKAGQRLSPMFFTRSHVHASNSPDILKENTPPLPAQTAKAHRPKNKSIAFTSPNVWFYLPKGMLLPPKRYAFATACPINPQATDYQSVKNKASTYKKEQERRAKIPCAARRQRAKQKRGTAHRHYGSTVPPIYYLKSYLPNLRQPDESTITQ